MFRGAFIHRALEKGFHIPCYSFRFRGGVFLMLQKRASTDLFLMLKKRASTGLFLMLQKRGSVSRMSAIISPYNVKQCPTAPCIQGLILKVVYSTDSGTEPAPFTHRHPDTGGNIVDAMIMIPTSKKTERLFFLLWGTHWICF